MLATFDCVRNCQAKSVSQSSSAEPHCAAGQSGEPDCAASFGSDLTRLTLPAILQPPHRQSHGLSHHNRRRRNGTPTALPSHSSSPAAPERQRFLTGHALHPGLRSGQRSFAGCVSVAWDAGNMLTWASCAAANSVRSLGVEFKWVESVEDIEKADVSLRFWITTTRRPLGVWSGLPAELCQHSARRNRSADRRTAQLELTGTAAEPLRTRTDDPVPGSRQLRLCARLAAQEIGRAHV